ncbi:MAG TPA: SMC family ATPase, partial [Methanomicrobiales archaeon]|nr:SMC family ATPase [Methanomicrobiales archaeon]
RLGPLLDKARDLAAIFRRTSEVNGDWEEVQERTLAVISRRDELEKELSSLGYDPAEGGRLERELGDLENTVREIAVIAGRLEGREVLERKTADLEARLERLEKECRAIDAEIRDLGFDHAAHQRFEEKYRVSEARHRRYLALRPEMDRIPVLKGRETDLKAREDSLAGETAELGRSIKEIAFSGEDLERARQELRRVQQQAIESAARRRGLATEKGGFEKERDRLTGLIGKLERDQREHDRLEEEIRLLELTREHLNGFTDHLLGVVRDQVQEETGRILSEITDDRYDTVLLDDAFELLVHDLGGDYPVSRFSGGEQDDVAIALRIALSRYIAGTHELQDSTFLIFDEIFGSQDEERRGNIFRALRALEPYFPQIFLISHVSEVQGEFGNTLVVEAVSERESRIRDPGEAAG